MSTGPYRTAPVALRVIAVCSWCRYQGSPALSGWCHAARRKHLHPQTGWEIVGDRLCEDANPQGQCRAYRPSLVSRILRRKT